jgi:hypothetical protein
VEPLALALGANALLEDARARRATILVTFIVVIVVCLRKIWSFVRGDGSKVRRHDETRYEWPEI